MNAPRVIADLKEEYGEHTPSIVKAMYDQVLSSGERPEVIEGWARACKMVGVEV